MRRNNKTVRSQVGNNKKLNSSLSLQDGFKPSLCVNVEGTKVSFSEKGISGDAVQQVIRFSFRGLGQ